MISTYSSGSLLPAPSTNMVVISTLPVGPGGGSVVAGGGGSVDGGVGRFQEMHGVIEKLSKRTSRLPISKDETIKPT